MDIRLLGSNSVPTTGTGVVPDLIFVTLLGSSVPTTGTGVVSDLIFFRLLGSGGIKNIVLFYFVKWFHSQFLLGIELRARIDV